MPEIKIPEEITVEWFVDFLKSILEVIFGFIAKSEGWPEAEDAE